MLQELPGHMGICVVIRGGKGRSAVASARLLDTDHVTRGVADCAVADAIRLVHRLMDDLGTARLELGENTESARRLL